LKRSEAERYLKSGVKEVLEKLVSLQSKVLKMMDERSTLSSDIERVSRIVSQYEHLKDQKIPAETMSKIEKLNEKTYDLFCDREDQQKKINQVKKLIQLYAESSEQIDRLEKSVKSENIQLIEVKNKLVDCPYCGTKLSQDAKRRLLNGKG
jgi:hypothetical protein